MSAWICQCDCGERRTLPTEHFKKGAFYSCGCFKSELLQLRNSTIRARKRLCGVEGCSLPHGAKGYCYPHYYQWNRYGDPLVRLRVKKGSGCVTRQGYRIINGKREHRSVMESFLGRTLTKDESVHHKKGDRSDNQIRNLELWSKSQPAGQRVVDKLCWAKSFLIQYDNLLEAA